VDDVQELAFVELQQVVAVLLVFRGHLQSHTR
jgi:hypothetical protein